MIGLAAVSAVIVLVIAGVIVFRGGNGSGNGAESAGAAVQGYLEALARGDAEAALALGRANAPDKTFLTDEILRKQMEKNRITEIKILGDTPGDDGRASVKVSAKFDGQRSDDKVSLDKPAAGEGWKLLSAAVATEVGLELVPPKLAPFITLFGTPVPKSGKAYLFPGWVDLGTSNPNLTVTATKVSTRVLQVLPTMQASILPEVDMSDQARDSIIEQVKAKFEECAKTNQISPPGCPNDSYGEGILVEGTAQWTAPTDTEVELGVLDPRTGTWTFQGNGHYQLTARSLRGNTLSSDMAGYLSGEVDMSVSPPKLIYDK